MPVGGDQAKLMREAEAQWEAHFVKLVRAYIRSNPVAARRGLQSFTEPPMDAKARKARILSLDQLMDVDPTGTLYDQALTQMQQATSFQETNDLLSSRLPAQRRRETQERKGGG